MTYEYLFRLFAISQGAFVLGLTAFIFSWYTSHYKQADNKKRRLLKIGFALSYIMLTVATIRTAIFSVYDWGDVWYWIVIAGYFIGDICLIYLFRLSLKNKF